MISECLTVVTFSSESAYSFSDIIPFSSVRPSRLKMKSTRSHSSLVLVVISFLPRGSILLWVKKIIIIIVTMKYKVIYHDSQPHGGINQCCDSSVHLPLA